MFRNRNTIHIKDPNNEKKFENSVWVAAFIVVCIFMIIGFLAFIAFFLDQNKELNHIEKDISLLEVNISSKCSKETCQLLEQDIEILNSSLISVKNNVEIIETDLDTLNETFFIFAENLFFNVIDSINSGIVYVNSITGDDLNKATVNDPVRTMSRAIEIALARPIKQIAVGPGQYSINELNFFSSARNADGISFFGSVQPVLQILCNSISNSFEQEENSDNLQTPYVPYDTICVTSTSLVPAQLEGFQASSSFAFSGESGIVKSNTNDTIIIYGRITSSFIFINNFLSEVTINGASENIQLSGLLFENLKITGNVLRTNSKTIIRNSIVTMNELNIQGPDITLIKGSLITINNNKGFTLSGNAQIIDSAIVSRLIIFDFLNLKGTGVTFETLGNNIMFFIGVQGTMNGFKIQNNNAIKIQRNSNILFVNGKINMNSCDRGTRTFLIREKSQVIFNLETNTPGVMFLQCSSGSPDYNIMVVSNSEFISFGRTVYNSFENRCIIIDSEYSDITLAGQLRFEGSFSQLLSAESSRIFPISNEKLIINETMIDASSTKPIIELTSCLLSNFREFNVFSMLLENVPRGLSISGGDIYWVGGSIEIVSNVGYALLLTDQVEASFNSLGISNVKFETISLTEPAVQVEFFSKLNLRGNNYVITSSDNSCVTVSQNSRINYFVGNANNLTLFCGQYELDIRDQSSAIVSRNSAFILQPGTSDQSRIGSLINATSTLLSLPNGVYGDGSGPGTEDCSILLR